MIEYRVTKYDPAFRDVRGAYTRDEWTAASDIGRSIGGTPLTDAEYRRVESAYVASALEFLRESGVPSLAVCGLENYGEALPVFGEGAVLSLEQIETMLPRMLRDEFWCRLESPDAFVHIGFDYYMYIGVAGACPESEHRAANRGLFVERFRSPHGHANPA